MTLELLEALIAYFESTKSGKCAPYDWSFKEQECVDNLLIILENQRVEIEEEMSAALGELDDEEDDYCPICLKETCSEDCEAYEEGY